MWIDLGAYVSADEIESVIQKDCGLAVDYVSWFGGEAYGTFIRVNLATREENIRLAAEKIVEALEAK